MRQHERDTSFAEFWRLVDAGLADAGRGRAAHTDQRTIEATRDQVAVARDLVPDPRGWAADPSVHADVVRRLVHRLTERLDTLRVSLEAGGRTTRLDQASDPAQVAVVVEATGTAYAPRHALVRLQEIHDELASAYDESVQNTLTELLGSTFIEHLRDRLTELRRLTSRINEVLSRHPTGTTRTRLRIHLAPAAGATEAVLSALEQGEAILDAEVAHRVRDFLRSRIDEARALSETGTGEWQHLLAEALDYRRWFAVTLQKKTGDGGHWTPLTSQNYAHLSGGARVVMLMLPFVATLTALYESMPAAPRPFWLDEAFDGLDTTNRATVLALLDEFDLDVLVVGPSRLLNSASVPVAAIYQVVRAEDPLPGADLAVELWAAGELHAVGAVGRVHRTPRRVERRRKPLRGCRISRGCGEERVPRALLEWAARPGAARVLAEVRRRAEQGTLGPRARVEVPLGPAERQDVGILLGIDWQIGSGSPPVASLRTALRRYAVTLEELLVATGGPVRDRAGERRAAAEDRVEDARRAREVLVGALGDELADPGCRTMPSDPRQGGASSSGERPGATVDGAGQARGTDRALGARSPVLRRCACPRPNAAAGAGGGTDAPPARRWVDGGGAADRGMARCLGIRGRGLRPGVLDGARPKPPLDRQSRARDRFFPGG